MSKWLTYAEAGIELGGQHKPWSKKTIQRLVQRRWLVSNVSVLASSRMIRKPVEKQYFFVNRDVSVLASSRMIRKCAPRSSNTSSCCGGRPHTIELHNNAVIPFTPHNSPHTVRLFRLVEYDNLLANLTRCV
jgi:hypothetical protein